jgi:selenocysteine lyase/cysteine desulfurase
MELARRDSGVQLRGSRYGGTATLSFTSPAMIRKQLLSRSPNAACSARMDLRHHRRIYGHEADGFVRAGCAAYTTAQEVERLIDGVREIAA